VSYLSALVVAKCRELGGVESARFFDVSEGLVRQWVAGTKPVSLLSVEKVFSPPAETPVEANWSGRDVMLLMPQYKTTHPITLFSLLALFDRTKMRASLRFNDAFIAHARNVLLDDLVASDCEYGFMADDDMVFPCGMAGWFKHQTSMPQLSDAAAGLHTLNRLRSHGKTLVSGVYFNRVPGRNRAMFSLSLNGSSEADSLNAELNRGPQDRLIEADWAGTGCLLIHRQVALDVRAKFPHLAPSRSGEPWKYFSTAPDAVMSAAAEAQGRLSVLLQSVSTQSYTAENLESEIGDLHKLVGGALAQTKARNTFEQGEDVQFGLRAKEAGHPTFVDLQVVCGHIGHKVYGPSFT
jgi:hypothetical protein